MAINVEYGASPIIPAIMAMLAGKRQAYGPPSGGGQSQGIADPSRAFQAALGQQMSAGNERASQERQFAQQVQMQQMRDAAGIREADARAQQRALDEATVWEFTPDARDELNKRQQDISAAQRKAASGEWAQEHANQIIQNAEQAITGIKPVRVARQTSGQKQEFSNNDIMGMRSEAYGQIMSGRAKGDNREPSDDEIEAAVANIANSIRRFRGDRPAPAPKPVDLIAPTTQPAAQGVAAAGEQSPGGLELAGVQNSPGASMAAQRVQEIEHALTAISEQLMEEGRRPTPEEVEIKDKLLRERRNLLARLNANR